MNNHKPRRQILKLIAAAVSAAVSSSTTSANAGLTPIVSFLLNEEQGEEPPVMQQDWFGSVGLLQDAEFQAMITAQALNRSVEIWVDAQRVTNGNEDGSFNNPFNNFNFLGGRNLDNQNWIKSSIPIVPQNTVIRLKGDFKYSDHVQGSHATNIQIRYDAMSNGNGGYNPFTGEPLIFAPWPDGSSYRFDAEGHAYPHLSTKPGEASPIFLLGSDNLYVDVAFYGLDLTGSNAALALHAFEGTRTLQLINCHVHDNAPPSNALYGNGGVGIHASRTNGTYVVDHCLFVNNSGSVTNNVGDINLKSVVSTDVALNKLTIKNSQFSGGFIAVTGKHSGNSTVEAFNNYFSGYRSVFYARGNIWNFHHNIMESISYSVAYPDYQGFNNAASIVFDHNTCVNSHRVLESTDEDPDDFPDGPIAWAFTNNVLIDSDFSGRSFHGQAVYVNGAKVPTTFAHSHNLYGFNSSAQALFFEFDVGSITEFRSFAQAMTELNDTTSAFVVPDIDLTTFRPIEGGNCDSTGLGGSNIGAL